MKKKSSKLIWLILGLLLVLGVMLYIYFKPPSDNSNNNSDNVREVQVGTGTIEKTITGSRRSIFKTNRKVGFKHK